LAPTLDNLGGCDRHIRFGLRVRSDHTGPVAGEREEMEDMRIPSYGSVYQIGHEAIADIFADPVILEEKIDGSLFAFCHTWQDEIFMRSKGSEIFITEDGCSQQMFKRASQTVKELSLNLNPTYFYYGEYLQKPKHNVHAYNRVPEKNIIIFDVCDENCKFLTHEEKLRESERIGLECVPIIFDGKVENFDQFMSYLERESILGGQKIEGFVVKNYERYTKDKKYMKGKFVSERFKETHAKNWKSDGNKQEIQAMIIKTLRTEARWLKAISHLAEKGILENSPRDIGNLIKEVQSDIEKEEKEFIMGKLYGHFKNNIMRGVVRGLPEWYKEELAKSVLNRP
jgi:hypothetical protein